MKEKIGLFTGSFDPMTKGHLDIILRASELFDQLYVGVFENDEKKSLFSLEERLQLIKENVSGIKNVELISHRRDLTVNIAAELGASALVRSVRNFEDFEYEANMSYFNHEMTGIETILLFAKPELGMISSTRMRELASYGQELSKYVPDNVAKELRGKFGK